MKLYDTLSKKKGDFRTLAKKKVRLFVCGPTVYDHSHIGHGRTYVVFDAFVKYLRNRGYEVQYIQNITDIDDKIITRAQKEKKDARALARTYEKEYHADMKALGVDAVTKCARATDYIPKIIRQIKTLIKKGYAYETETGVYFEVAKFPNYGKLSGQNIKMLERSTRIEKDTSKHDAVDFALWKKAKPGEPTWDSPWGKGRPGWHIEDTAITETELGPQYDVHGGSRDLIFPHHEAEIAQMETASGKKPLVRYWMHTGFLTLENVKMSKSLGNVITIQDLLASYSLYDFRLFILSKHYRSPITYTKRYLKEAKAQRARIEEFIRKLANAGGVTTLKDKKYIRNAQKKFWAALADDFSVPGALSVLFALISHVNKRLDKETLGKREADALGKFFAELNTIFNIINFTREAEPRPESAVLKLVKEREMLRREKKWQKADVLRKKIERLGYAIDDTPSGSHLRRI